MYQRTDSCLTFKPKSFLRLGEGGGAAVCSSSDCFPTLPPPRSFWPPCRSSCFSCKLRLRSFCRAAPFVWMTGPYAHDKLLHMLHDCFSLTFSINSVLNSQRKAASYNLIVPDAQAALNRLHSSVLHYSFQLHEHHMSLFCMYLIAVTHLKGLQDCKYMLKQ